MRWVKGYKIEPGANLEGADLTGANLTGADLTDTGVTDTGVEWYSDYNP